MNTEKNEVAAITGTARQLLGDAQIEALKDHVRKENGRVPASKMIEEIIQIFKGSQVKNS